MNQINQVNSELKAQQLRESARPASIDRSQKSNLAETTRGLAADDVELSDIGQFMSMIQDLPDVRAEKVVEVRREIQSDPDRYIQDRLEETASRIVEDLLGI